MTDNVNYLLERLKDARESYYGEGTSPITDAEYDALENELRAVDPDNELLKKVGSEPASNWLKVKHLIPMGSLNKSQNEEQWKNWIKKLPKGSVLAITEKFDGISISLEYNQGTLITATTRGDGIIGEDITKNVQMMKNVIHQMPYKWDGHVRGEIMLFKSDHKEHMSDKKNPRNAAAGTAKRLDGVGCEHLTVQYYEAFSPGSPFYSLAEQYEFIANSGMNTTMCMLITNPEEMLDIIKTWNDNREEMDYEIDGLVARLNIQDEFESYGVVDGRPKGAVAYKFPPIQKETLVIGITWQVGKTGRVTPVAELEPVDIGGVTIKRVSLHTARIAMDSGAGPGARVVISRRNDVIPYVESVIPGTEQPISEPTNLGDLKWEGEYLTVKKLDDKIELYNSIKVWVQRLRILHWGDSFIHMLIDYGLVKSLGDLYRLDWEQVAQFAGSGIGKRAKESLDSKRTMDLASFISALNIRHCNSTAELIVGAGVDTIAKFLDYGCAARWLVDVEGIGKVKAAAIEKDVSWMANVIVDLKQYVVIEQKIGSLIGKSFCITGALPKSRDEYVEIINNNGGEYKGGMSKNVTHLITNTPDSNTVKNQKALKLGIKIITAEGFDGLL